MSEEVIICLCTLCNEGITQSQMDREEVEDNFVYKYGELDYIELFHSKCYNEWQKEISND